MRGGRTLTSGLAFFIRALSLVFPLVSEGDDVALGVWVQKMRSGTRVRLNILRSIL